MSSLTPAWSSTFTTGTVIEIHTCSFRSLRGYTVIGAACDELAFWDDEDSANPDHEVLVALRAAMASVPEAMLVALTSVYARRGEVWRTFEKHFGRNASEAVLVENGPTTAMNPTIDPEIIAAAYEDDPIAAAAEFGAEFRRDVEAFLPADALDAVTMPGRFEQPFQVAHRGSYCGFLDPAGGTGQDAMAIGIAHPENGRVVLDVVREVRPPFSPEANDPDQPVHLVLREVVVTSTADGFGHAAGTQYRELALVNGVYQVRVWTPSDRR